MKQKTSSKNFIKTTLLGTIAILSLNTNVTAQTVATTTITGNLKVNDSLHVVNNISTSGDVKATGEIIAKDTMRAQKDVIVDGNVSVGNNLKVAGTTFLSGDLYANDLKLGNSTSSFDFKSYSINSTSSFLGIGIDAIAADNFQTAAANSSFCWAPAGGTVVKELTVLAPLTSSTENHLSIQTDRKDGFITLVHPAIFTGNGGPGTLKINESCLGGVNIAKGGGIVSTGNNFEVGSPTRDINVAANVYVGSKIGLKVQSNNVYNTQLFVNQSTFKALTVFNTQTNTAGDETFIIQGNGNTILNIGGTDTKALTVKNSATNATVFEVLNSGRTFIGQDRVVNGPHTDAILSVGGNGKIACKEVRVFTNNWADYVFDKNYKLMPLLEVENYYNTNKHLPNVPTTENIIKEGNDLAKTDAMLLAKIEELTLYIVELKKEVNALKQK